ncbi:23S rRNA (guanosine(2251)-2'-O)-methyltransferase RlmB [Candidatus Dependentiae bacterium]|nr:23S rRNA (guanosine(2251)-2'-O)-methyltransferase RlmB [Candidatus Dependentiae bacterium]
MIIYGKNPVTEYLTHRKSDVIKLFSCDDKTKSFFENNFKINVCKTDQKFFYSKLKSNNINHQNILAEIEMTNIMDIDELIIQTLSPKNKNKILLVLDHISDPQNFGAIIRSAVFFNIAGIIIAKDRQTPINSTVIKTSSGMSALAKFSVVPNIANTIQKLKQHNFTVYSAVKDCGCSPEEINVSSPIVLIVGSEGDGIQKNVLKLSDFYVSIKGSKSVESLNVSVSTAILLYQISSNINSMSGGK